jgi:hypothetical protein
MRTRAVQNGRIWEWESAKRTQSTWLALRHCQATAEAATCVSISARIRNTDDNGLLGTDDAVKPRRVHRDCPELDEIWLVPDSILVLCSFSFLLTSFRAWFIVHNVSERSQLHLSRVFSTLYLFVYY